MTVGAALNTFRNLLQPGQTFPVWTMNNAIPVQVNGWTLAALQSPNLLGLFPGTNWPLISVTSAQVTAFCNYIDNHCAPTQYRTVLSDRLWKESGSRREKERVTRRGNCSSATTLVRHAV